jgi:hypothetical protein
MYQGKHKQHQHDQHCYEYILAAIKNANQAITYRDLGEEYSYGTLRNTMSKLVEQGKVLSLP